MSASYAKGAERIWRSSVNWETANIKAVLVKNTYVQDLDTHEFLSDISAYVTSTLVPPPSDAGTLKMDVYRLPLDSFETKNEPEIGQAHHRHLVAWVLFKAFSKPDAETIDKTKAAEAYARFEAYFGRRPDAQLGRDMAADQPHHNVTYI